MKAKKQIKVLPYPVYFWTVFAVALAGLLDALYLSISHYRVYTDMGYKSFCAISKAINCDTVSQSPYSIFLNVPVPVWGLLGYTTFLLLLIASYRFRPPQTRMWPILFIFASCFSAISIVLAIISISNISSHCIMCLASHAVSFMLLFLTWLVYRRMGSSSLSSGISNDVRFFLAHKKPIALVATTALLGVMAMTLFFPSYWKLTLIPPQTELSMGITEDGHPWIGAQDPQLVIVEFTDYQCFQCRKMHFYLRQLMARFPEKLRLVHRHFPMDHSINPIVKEPYHVGSAKMALMAIFAAEKNRFWEMNDRLFNADIQDGLFNIREIARNLDFDVHELAASVSNPTYQLSLKNDIQTGISLGINGTPGYFIKDKVYTGHVPSTVLNAILK